MPPSPFGDAPGYPPPPNSDPPRPENIPVQRLPVSNFSRNSIHGANGLTPKARERASATSRGARSKTAEKRIFFVKSRSDRHLVQRALLAAFPVHRPPPHHVPTP